jgi:hypothetical protein
VRVGKDNKKEEYEVPATLLTKRSAYFITALKDCWKKENDHFIEFPEDEPEVFELYLHLVYRRDLPLNAIHTTDQTDDGQLTDIAKTNQSDSYSTPTSIRTQSEVQSYILAKLYVFAEKVLDNDAKGEILQQWKRSGLVEDAALQQYSHVQAIDIIYNGTLEGSLARELFLNVFACSATGTVFSAGEQYNPEFLAELVPELYKRLEMQGRREHSHSE